MKIALTVIAILCLCEMWIEIFASLRPVKDSKRYVVDLKLNIYRMSIVVLILLGVLVTWITSSLLN